MPKAHPKRRDAGDWNVLVTIHEEGFRAACALLREFGAVMPSDYHNVLTMRVEDIARFTTLLAERAQAEPGILNFLSHVAPAGLIFEFQNVDGFEAGARDAVLRLAPRLAGREFHVRIHRRGFKHRISAQHEEQRLDKIILEFLKSAGDQGAVSFDDPDAIVDIETLGQRAGVSLWTREDLRRYPFLHLD